VAPVEGDCEQQPVDTLMGEMSRLRGRNVVARADRAAEFGLDNPGYRVDVTIQPPKPPDAASQSAEEASVPDPEPVTYSVSLSERDGKVYAMRGAGFTICEVDAKVLNDLKAEFLETVVFKFEPSQAIGLGVQGDATFRFTKEGDDWVLAGEASFPSDANKIREYMTELKNLRLNRYAAYQNADMAQFGLAEPMLRIGITKQDGTEQTLMLSAKGPEDGGSYAAISTQPDRVFVLKPDVVTKLRKAVADFRKAN
jgi:hypothetical protein